MTRDDEHQDLQRLFDETADRASGPTLTKLAARALDVPQRAGRVPRYLPRWAFSPAFAGVALAVAAALALVLAVPGSPPPERSVASVAVTPALRDSARLPIASSRAPAPSPTQLAADSLDTESDLGLGLYDTSEGSSFNVSGPGSDQDLDAWLAASKALADGS